MQFLISKEEIEATESFKKLEKFAKNIILQLSNKKDISVGIISFRSTGVIPGSISGNNLKVLKDLLKKETNNIP